MSASKTIPLTRPSSGTAFRKRKYTLGQLRTDAAVLSGRRKEVQAIWGSEHRVTPQMREQVMLGVARVNACGFCTYIHQENALEAGVDLDFLGAVAGVERTPDMDDDAMLAVLWATSRAENNLGPADEALDAVFKERFTEEEQRDLDTVLRGMHMMNLCGNTLEALLWRLRGNRVPGSRLVDEVLIGGGYFLGAIPMGVLTARQRGKTVRTAFQEAVATIRAAA